MDCGQFSSGKSSDFVKGRIVRAVRAYVTNMVAIIGTSFGSAPAHEAVVRLQRPRHHLLRLLPPGRRHRRRQRHLESGNEPACDRGHRRLLQHVHAAQVPAPTAGGARGQGAVARVHVEVQFEVPCYMCQLLGCACILLGFINSFPCL